MLTNPIRERGTVSVRPAVSGDIPTLVALMFDFYAESEYALDRDWAQDSFHELLASPALGAVWLAHAGVEPIGHAVLTVRWTMEHGGLSGYIDDLYVRPDFRRMGAGTALLEELLEDCRRRSCQSAQVEVAAGNAPARALYRRFGLLEAQDDRVLLSGVISWAGA
jgi:ribosomal protein S18 acetylase RimI-like enzyme